MLRKLKELFCTFDADHPPSERDIQLASAALLVEVSTADQSLDAREEQTIIEAIRKTYKLDSADIDSLLQEAKTASANSPSLYDFTRVINEHCGEEEKYKLVRECWRVAFADGHLDKYEDHRIRKIAELIYLPHSLFIKAKLDVVGQH
ncbi:MAG: TerB family tellurite resistance protein [Spongiibacteraceae bacterium]